MSTKPNESAPKNESTPVKSEELVLDVGELDANANEARTYDQMQWDTAGKGWAQ